ncbi:YlaH-like family protein [Oceanobacillus kapialis]|uniref:YlaH-like family protein n=1 Tax=Oceanobacillus kapialis TaxID=481353 RepID=A0ABW5PYB7_9BACI
MDTSFSLLFDLYVDNFGTDHIYVTFYLLNLLFGAIAFKLGFARKLPLLKTIFVYIMLAVGVYILTIFSILKLPITESLLVVSLVLGIYRFRLHRERNARE